MKAEEEYQRYSINKSMDFIQKVRKEFAFFEDRCFAIMVFGSYAKGHTVSNSDIDVCIVAKSSEKKDLFYNEICLKVRMDVYDVVIFEDCNDELKSGIAKNHIVVYCEDETELDQYLKPYKSLEFKIRTLKEIVGELRSVTDGI
jgi:predicted nucleotidyltransferase